MASKLPAKQALLDLTSFSVDRIAAATVEECVDTLRVLGPRLAETRDGTGLILWRLAHTATEKVYADEARRIAATLDVGVDTLTRWRTRAEQEHGLTAATPRTIARRQRATHAPPRVSGPPALPPSTAEQIASAPLEGPPVLPAPPKRKAPPPPDNPCVRCRGTGIEPERRGVADVAPPRPATCLHPWSRRLGNKCQDCGAHVGTLGTIGGR